MPSEALQVAAKRLPVRRKEALAAEDIQKLMDVSESVSRAYQVHEHLSLCSLLLLLQIFPEEKPAEVAELHTQAELVLQHLQQQVQQQVQQQLRSCNTRIQQLEKLEAVSKDPRASTNMRFMAGQYFGDMSKAVKQELRQALAGMPGDETEQLKQLIEVTNDMAIKAAAEAELKHRQVLIAKLTQGEQGKKNRT